MNDINIKLGRQGTERMDRKFSQVLEFRTFVKRKDLLLIAQDKEHV